MSVTRDSGSGRGPTHPAALRGRSQLLRSVSHALEDGQQLLVLRGPTGAGRRTLAEAALGALGRTSLVLDGYPFARLHDVLEAVVAQSDTLTLEARDSAARVASHVAASGAGLVICDAGPLSASTWQELSDWVELDAGLRVVVTTWQQPELPSEVRSMEVPGWSSADAADVEAGWATFVDAVSSVSLRERLTRVEPAVRARVVESCGGLPLLLRLAGARTRFLDPNHVVELLVQTEAPQHLQALTALFGSAYSDALVRMLPAIPLAARDTLALCREVGPVFGLEDVLHMLQTMSEFASEVGSEGASSAATLIAGRVAMLRRTCVDQLKTLADAGLLVVNHDTETTEFRLPRHVMAVMDTLLEGGTNEERSWVDALPRAARTSMARRAQAVLNASDRYLENDARELARRLRTPLLQLVTDDAGSERFGAWEYVVCLGALAWFWRRTGIDRRYWRECFRRVLDVSSPDRFASLLLRGETADRLAQALAEVHLLARQAGDAAARDAIAVRMRDLLQTCDDSWDRGAASARSRYAYVLAASAFTAGDRTAARALAMQAVEEARKGARNDLQARHATVLAFVEFEAGEHAPAVMRMEDAVSVLARLGATQECATATANMAILAYQHGAIDLATASFRQAASAGSGQWDRTLQARALMGLARCLDVLQSREARQVHEQTLGLVEAIGDDAQRSEALTRYGWHRILQSPDSAGEGLGLIARAMDLEQTVGRERLRTHTMHAYALALAAVGQLSEAFHQASMCLERIQATRSQHYVEVMALVAALTPDPDEAGLKMGMVHELAAGLGSDATRVLVAAEALYVSLRQHAAAGAGSADGDDAVRRSLEWLMMPTPPPFGAIRTPRPRWQRSLTMAGTMKRLRGALDQQMVISLESQLYRRPGELMVTSGGLDVQTHEGQWIHLGATPVLARVLYAIARDTLHGGMCALETCIEAGWPGERIQPDAASNRLYQAISRLRRQGLREVIESCEGGYRISGAVRVVIPPTF